jgi:Tol biopolymer transport system component
MKTVVAIVVFALAVVGVGGLIARTYRPTKLMPPREIPGTMAFVADGDVFVSSSNDGEYHRLTNDSLAERNPSLSPDGTLVAFLKAQSSDRNTSWDLWVVRKDGGEVVDLTKGTSSKGGFLRPIWAPDGTRLLLGWYVYGLDGSAIQVLKTNEVGLGWAPDSRSILYVNSVEIHVMALDGLIDSRVGSFHGDQASWSPDGEWIAFQLIEEVKATSDAPAFNRGHGLWLVRTNGTDLHKAPTDNSGEPVVWSPDSQSVAMQSGHDIRVLNLASGRQWKVTPGPDGIKFGDVWCGCGGRNAVWSPDGQQLAFVSQRESGNWIYIVNANGTGRKRLAPAGASHQSDPSWSR